MRAEPHETSPWWGVALIVLGGALIAGGLLLGGTWADVAIEVGAAAGVGGIVLLFKNRFMRQVDKRATEAAITTAEATITPTTEALEELRIRLDSLRDIQATEKERQQEHSQQIGSAIGEAASFRNIYNLLEEADKLQYFANGLLVKAGGDAAQPLLHIFRYSYKEPDQPRTEIVYFTVVPFDERSGTYSEAEGAAIGWTEEGSIQDVVRRTIRAYVRLNLPYGDLSLETALSNLRDSYRLMDEARQEPQGSNRRLEGSLLFRMNEEWVLTDVGLEAVRLDRTYRWIYDHRMELQYIDLDRAVRSDDADMLMWLEAEEYGRKLRFNDDWEAE